MNKSELVAQQLMSAAINQKTWEGMGYNASAFGVYPGDADMTSAMQSLVNKTKADGFQTIIMAPGQYYVTTLTNTDGIVFIGDNAEFVGGFTGTILSLGDIPAQAEVTGVVAQTYGAGPDKSASVNTAAIQAAINKAVTDGKQIVRLAAPGTYAVTPEALTNADKVTFVGDDATLSGAYNLGVYPGGGVLTERASLLYQKALNGLIPYGSLDQAKRAINRGTLKVAFVGDSITETFDTFDYAGGYVAKVTQMLRDALPGVTVDAFNFGLAGRTFGWTAQETYVAAYPEPDASVGFWRPWATLGKSYRAHIRDYQPDMVVIAWGMNDAHGAGSDSWEATNWQTFATYMDTWAKKPSVVAVSTIVPTRNTNRYDQSAIVTHTVARSTRETAKNRGFALADANRLYRILLEGKDEGTTETEQELNFEGFYTGRWIGDTGSFTLTGGNTLSSVATNKFVYRNRPDFIDGTITVDVYPTVAGDPGSIAWINYRQDDALGKMTVHIVAGATEGVVSLYSNFEAVAHSGYVSVPINQISNIKIEVAGSRHRVYLNGVQVIDAVSYERLHAGRVGVGSDSQIPTFSNLKVDYHLTPKVSPLYSEDDLLGIFNNGQTAVNTGNGVNHPSTLTHSTVYAASFLHIVAALARSPKETWIPITLQNGWVDYGGSFASAAYRKMGVDRVCFKGLIKNGTYAGGTLLFTLPENMRPSETRIIKVASASGSTDVLGTLWVAPDGQVTVGYIAGNSYLTLEGAYYDL